MLRHRIQCQDIGALQPGQDIIPLYSAKAMPGGSSSCVSSHIPSEHACGLGTRCPDGGSRGNCVTRNSIWEEYSHAQQRKGTGSVQDFMPGILICCRAISILNSEQEFGPDMKFTGNILVRHAVSRLLPEEAGSCFLMI